MTRAGLADDVAVPGQRVLDEHGIVGGRVQGPPGLIGDGHVREVASTLEVDGADDIINDYRVVVLKDAKNAEGAQKFLDLILSDSGQKTLKDFGFGAPVVK